MSDAFPLTAVNTNAALVLADGSVFYGKSIGGEGTSVIGELCFNTAMTGYQEILTDPSYAGQIIVFTFPHIGNVGVNEQDIESKTSSARGIILREEITPPSNFRSKQKFDEWLAARGIAGIYGIDTRALTRLIRKKGPQNAVIYIGEANIDALKEQVKNWPGLAEFDLTREVSVQSSLAWNEKLWSLADGHKASEKQDFHVVAVDYGAKYNILRHLAERKCKVTVVPATTTLDEILALHPDGVFLSNGPGDPVVTAPLSIPVIQGIIEVGIPLFGICLGHQLMALALGGKTEKMKQGHRGANHPIRHVKTGAVEITSQNHGYVVSKENLPKNITITHTSLFDGTIAGLEVLGKPVFAVQYHPESSPGPHDSRYLFDKFLEMMRERVQSSEFRVQNYGS